MIPLFIYTALPSRQATPNTARETHLPENTGDKEMDVIVGELKDGTTKPVMAEKH
jgi:hypothetical protein